MTHNKGSDDNISAHFHLMKTSVNIYRAPPHHACTNIQTRTPSEQQKRFRNKGVTEI